MNKINVSAEALLKARSNSQNNELRINETITKTKALKDKFNKHIDDVKEIDTLLLNLVSSIAYDELSTDELLELKNKKAEIDKLTNFFKDELCLYDDAVNMLVSKRIELIKEQNNAFMLFINDMIDVSLSCISDYEPVRQLFYSIYLIVPDNNFKVNNLYEEIGKNLLKAAFTEVGLSLNNESSRTAMESKILELSGSQCNVDLTVC